MWHVTEPDDAKPVMVSPAFRTCLMSYTSTAVAFTETAGISETPFRVTVAVWAVAAELVTMMLVTAHVFPAGTVTRVWLEVGIADR
jgi:hypothetical protein